jgi:hypothetical protein
LLANMFVKCNIVALQESYEYAAGAFYAVKREASLDFSPFSFDCNPLPRDNVKSINSLSVRSRRIVVSAAWILD